MQPARFSPLSLSQNFLTSRALVDRLLTASSIRTGDLVFDLGAGSGLIAERLARRGCDVVAVEKDPGLAHTLKSGLPTRRRSGCTAVMSEQWPCRIGRIKSSPTYRSTHLPPLSIA